MIHQNTYLGLDRDTAFSKYKNNKYYNLENFRVITDSGSSTGSLENIKGNYKLTNSDTTINPQFFPIDGFMSIEATSTASEDTTTKSATFQITTSDNTIFIPITTISFTNANELLDEIESTLESYNLGKSNSKKLYYTRLESYPRIIIHTYNYNISITYASITSTYATSEVYGKASDFIIIGDTTIRDNIILFTINNTGNTKYSQLWNFTYDLANPKESSKIELLYHGKLDFNILNRISVNGRYENINTQKVYWNDYLNPPRNCNVVQEDLLAFRSIDFLSVTEIQLFPAYVTTEDQTGGNLPTGLWYITYKLFKSGNSTTPNAPISSATPVFEDDILGNEISGSDTDYEFVNYTVTEIKSTKILNFKIPNIPKGFEQIQVYAVLESSPALYKAFLYKTDFLSNNDTYEFNLSDVDDLIEVPIEDLFDYNIDFEKVKTQDIKDNLLIYANIKQAIFNVDFDSRVYRFRPSLANEDPLTSGIYGNSSLIPDYNLDNWDIDKKEDVINPLNVDNSAVDSNNNLLNEYRYKKDGITLGGEGPNISYEFTFEPILLDDSESVNLKSGDGGSTLTPELTPFINQKVNQSIIKNITNGDNLTLEIGPGFNNFKNNKIETYLKGYMRDEIYRFGIVFYSKTGRLSEVKWIADIRMPCAGDYPYDSNYVSESAIAQYHFNTLTGNPAFYNAKIPVSWQSNKKGTIGNVLGIKFTVNVDSIKDKISGFSIVRSPRREKDRTIIAEGALGEVYSNSSITTPGFYNFTRIEDSSEVGTEQINAGTPAYQYGTLDCPDLKIPSGATIEEYDSNSVSKYKLKPVAGYVHVSTTNNSSAGYEKGTAKGGTQDGTASKPYDRYSKAVVLGSQRTYRQRVETSLDFSRGTITEIKNVEKGQNIKLNNNADTFYNKGYLSNAHTPGSKVLASDGCKTIVFKGGGTNSIKMLINNTFGKGYLSSSLINKHPFDTPYTAFTDNYQINYLGWYTYGSGVNTRRHGQVAIVDICRDLDNQYGGATYLQRQNTEYIFTGYYTSVNSEDSTKEAKVFGGDIYQSLYTEKKLFGVDSGAYQSPVIGKIFPIQSIINTDMRNGYHLNNYIDSSTSSTTHTRRKTEDEYVIPILYHREKTLQTYTTEGANQLISEYDNRIYISEKKSNGETSDSWTVFKPLNYLDVDGHYGPINRITVLNDKLIYFQDKGFGEILLNPRTTITDTDGGEVQLGTGQGLIDYNYISTSVGCKHQWGVLNAKNSIYFFDSNLKKLFRYRGQGSESLSDLKGISSFFYNDIKGTVINKDTPLNFEGITAVYDHRFNDVIFTFHSIIDIPPITTITTETIGLLEVPVITITSTKTQSQTIVFNERLNEFAGFYSFTPRHYVSDNKKIFSQGTDYKLYIHDEGNRGEFYGTIYPSKLTLVINPTGNYNKVFNNQEFLSQVEDTTGDNVTLETIDKTRFYNEYQNTGDITLIPQNNLRRRLRTWRMAIGRDLTTQSIGVLPRMRNPYLLQDIEYQNNNNKRIILNDIYTYYVDSPY